MIRFHNMRFAITKYVNQNDKGLAIFKNEYVYCQ